MHWWKKPTFNIHVISPIDKNQNDEIRDLGSEHVLSVLELIPLKYSPKHNGKIIAFIGTNNILSDEEKTENEPDHEMAKRIQPKIQSSVNGSFKRMKKGIFIRLNKTYQRITLRKKNSHKKVLLKYFRQLLPVLVSAHSFDNK